MIYLHQDIGRGTVRGSGAVVDIDVHFEWPPEAIATFGSSTYG